MATQRKRRTPKVKVGQSPGTLVIPAGAPKPRLRLALYGPDTLERREDVSAKDLPKLLSGERNAWLEVVGIGDEAVLLAIAEAFQMPRLALEDVTHSPQRPKADAYDEALFLVLRIPGAGEGMELEQLSIFVRGRAAVSFVERDEPALEQLSRRLDDAQGRLRQRGIDYLVYRLCDSAVDAYFPLLERMGEAVHAIESEAIRDCTPRLLRQLYALTHDLRTLLPVCVPMRDLLSSLRRDAPTFMQAHNLPYLRDVQDHASQVVELTEYYRNVAGDVRDLIHGTLNLRMNQVMRMLTALAAVFIPLTFIAGIYGMNFEHMPELDWRWGYPVVLGSMALVAVASFAWFRRHGWLRIGDE
jgi:magnesium transporter